MIPSVTAGNNSSQCNTLVSIAKKHQGDLPFIGSSKEIISMQPERKDGRLVGVRCIPQN